MPKPNVLILRAPGTNCDQETGYAFELAGGSVCFTHINQVLESPHLLQQYQILCLPGGFSYGDDIAAGRILATQLQARLSAAIADFRDQGKLILGICNGFQILIKSGFLIPPNGGGLPATLTWNNSGRFIDTWVHLQVAGNKCVFLKDLDRLYLPIAHAEGRFVTRDDQTYQQLLSNQQLAIKYVPDPSFNGAASEDGSIESMPYNPNGSVGDVAGVCDDTGRLFGLMPHPERHVDATQHPQWTRQGLAKEGQGLALFRNAVKYFS